MRICFLLLVCASALGSSYEQSDYRHWLPHPFVKSQNRNFDAEVRSGYLEALARRTDAVIDQAVSRTLSEVRTQHPEEELRAEEFEYLFSSQYRGFLVRMVSERHQGDHKPLIQFLVNIYEWAKAKIGVDACKALHISDLATISWSIPIVFHPATFPQAASGEMRIKDYRDHFAMDSGADFLYGLAPVVSYWTVDVACIAGTAGIATFFCGPAGMAAEYLMGHWIAPLLSDWIFNKANGV